MEFCAVKCNQIHVLILHTVVIILQGGLYLHDVFRYACANTACYLLGHSAKMLRVSIAIKGNGMHLNFLADALLHMSQRVWA